jgi:hypothetical protein
MSETRKAESEKQKRKSGVVVPNQPTRLQRSGAWLVSALLRTLSLTIRFNWDGCAKIIKDPPTGPMIFCLWHNRLGLCVEAYGKLKTVSRRGGVAALVPFWRASGLNRYAVHRVVAVPRRCWN